MGVKVEEGIPLPLSGTGRGGRWGTGTPWADIASEMKEGQSALVMTKNEARCLRGALEAKQKAYCQRSREGGYRIWCLGLSDGKDSILRKIKLTEVPAVLYIEPPTGGAE